MSQPSAAPISLRKHTADIGVRPDFSHIAEAIPSQARVLDLGCGDGTLLEYLKQTRDIHGYGVEISNANITQCIHHGINVIQMNLEEGLSVFESDSFDFVILSQTLQTIRKSERIIHEMLRVGRQGIVTFPNFGYWRHRWQLLLGHMPVSDTLPYQWYDTPNVHLCTIKDFESFCHRQNIRILGRVIMTRDKTITALPNVLGSLAVYRFEAFT